MKPNNTSITSITISSDEDDQAAPPDSKAAASNSEQLPKNGEVKKEEKDEESASDGGSDIKCSVKENITLKCQASKEDISNMIVKCSSCSKQVNHHDPHRIKIHPDLKVLICKDCAEFYGNGEFSQDEEGDKYCRWCAQGGRVYGCDFCTNVFCVDCIHRNFGRAESRRVREDKWKCYMCDPSKLQEKMNFCTLIVDYSNAKQQKKVKKPNIGSVSCTIEELQLKSNVPSEWLPKAVDCLMTSASRFNHRINKLKNFSMLGKSTNRIVSKLEKVVDDHKAEMKGILENINEKHNKYKREKLSQLMKPEINDSKESTHVINSDVKDSTHVINSDVKVSTPKKNSDLKVKSDINLLDETPCVTGAGSPSNGNLQDFSDLDSKLNVASQDTHQTSVEKDLEMSVEDCTKQNSDIEGVNISDADVPAAHSPPMFEENSLSGINTAPNSCSDDKKDTPLIFTNDDAKKLLLQSMHSDDESDASTIPEIKSKTVPKKTTDSSDLESSEDDYDSASITGPLSAKKKKVKLSKTKRSKKANRSHFFSKDETHSRTEYENDEKLNSKPVVVLTRISIDMPAIPDQASKSDHSADDQNSSQEDELTRLKRTVDKLLKLPTAKRPRRSSDGSGAAPCPASKKPKKKPAEKKKVSSSESWSLSSGEEMDSKPNIVVVPIVPAKTINDKSKQILLATSGSSSSERDVFSDSSGIQELSSKKKKASGKNRKDSNEDEELPSAKEDSDEDTDDFVATKPKKGDKLLNVPLVKNDKEKSDDKAGDKDKKSAKDNKKKRKRRMMYSDDSNEDSKESSSSSTSSSSSSESRKKKKGKAKRKRIKTADDSSDDQDKDKDKDKDDDKGTPKGRRNIRKVISDKKLTESTREAQEKEKERRKRVAERQKLYNKITENSADGLSTITKKMVLEVDQDSKEEIVEIHEDLICKLKPHQVNGVKFMWESTIESVKLLDKPGSGCILAHCMGLGKTLQVIAFLHTILTNKYVKKKIRTALVICPYNTVLNWATEFRKWLDDVENEVNIFDLNWDKTNYDRRDRLDTWMEEGGVMILGYNLYTRLAEGKLGGKCPKKLKQAIMKSFCDPGPDIVICDEGHMLKNENSALSKAANKMKTARRIVLTGTPLQNNLKEYHCMMHFVKPDLLGTMREFSNRFANPISNGQYDNSSQHDVKKMKKRVHILHKLLEGCVQRCDYSALTKYLPPKHEFVISVQLSDEQIKLYKYYLETFAKGESTDKVDGRQLFRDYKMLKYVWTYPYLLYDEFYRQEKIRLLKWDDEDDDDFIDDKTSGEENESEGDKAGGSKKEGESSEEEVVRTYKTRSRAADADEEDSNMSTEKGDPVNHWWSEHVKEDDDKFKIELSGKIVLLLDILKQCESIGDKLLVFSTSLLTLNLIEDILQNVAQQSNENKEEGIPDTINKWVPNIDYFRMDGNTPAELRRKWIDLFNDAEDLRARLFLISTKAGSLGTNLVGANRVILMDASWNPSHDVQAIFRVYRFGQIKPVYVYRLLAQGTMEEKIYNRQVTKLSLSCRVVDEQQIDRHFNPSDLQELYNLEIIEDRPTPMVPKDRLLADILINHSKWIVKYHEHDSLLQSSNEDDLTEEERQTAWAEYENEKEGAPVVDEPMNNTFMNMDALLNIDMHVLVNNWTKEIQRKISDPTAVSAILGRANLVRSQLQTKHAAVLRTKKMYISRNEAVPQQITDWQFKLQVNIEVLNQFVQRMFKIFTPGAAQAQPRPTYYRPQQATFANYGAAQYGMRMPHFTYGQRPTFNFQNNTNLATEKPVIVDITSDRNVPVASVSTTTPIVTEVEEVKSTTNEASSTEKNKDTYEITEVE